ncbi:hypothetical protein TNCV_4744871 [Trichonephila clavipes]|nr:hypothetical protein TNCV_4744871 [Trichonephila clavipes]
MFMVLETWVRRGGRDFGRGGPVGVLETLAVEVIFDWRLEVVQLFSDLSRLADHNYNLTLTTMASNTDLPTDMDFQNATLPKSGNSTPERLSGPTPCEKLEATKADIRRYTLIVQGFENMISSLRQKTSI